MFVESFSFVETFPGNIFSTVYTLTLPYLILFALDPFQFNSSPMVKIHHDVLLPDAFAPQLRFSCDSKLTLRAMGSKKRTGEKWGCREALLCSVSRG